jgi:hypothetical protein
VRANLHGLDSTRGSPRDIDAPPPSRPRCSSRRTEPSAAALRVQGEGEPLHGIRRGAPRGWPPQSSQPLPPPLYRIGCHRASGSRVGASHHGLHSVEGLQAALERAEAALCTLADAEQSRILIFRGPEVCQVVVGYLVIVMRKWRLIWGSATQRIFGGGWRGSVQLFRAALWLIVARHTGALLSLLLM